MLRAGGAAADMSYGNTVKRAADIAYAHALGVRRFTFDSAGELAKLTEHAPGLHRDGPDHHLRHRRRLGAGRQVRLPADAAAELLVQAVQAGHPVGVAFHVGSQQSDPLAWNEPLAATARAARRWCARSGADLAVVDLGGGLPASMREPTARWRSTARPSGRRSPGTSARTCPR